MVPLDLTSLTLFEWKNMIGLWEREREEILIDLWEGTVKLNDCKINQSIWPDMRCPVRQSVRCNSWEKLEDGGIKWSVIEWILFPWNRIDWIGPKRTPSHREGCELCFTPVLQCPVHLTGTVDVTWSHFRKALQNVLQKAVSCFPHRIQGTHHNCINRWEREREKS